MIPKKTPAKKVVKKAVPAKVPKVEPPKSLINRAKERAHKLLEDILAGDIMVPDSYLGELKRKAPPKTKKDKLDPFGQELQKIWGRASFGCQRPHVEAILKAIYLEIKGEKLELPSDDKALNLPTGTLVVAKTNPNSHNYGKNPAMIREDKCNLLRPDGSVGNSITNNIRLATPEEIDGFFAALAFLAKDCSKTALALKD